MVFEFAAHQELQLLLLLVSGAALLILAGPLRIPYPILLVLGGLLIGFAPGVPTVTMPPDVVLIGILPPLLYLSAYNTGLRELRQNLRPISLLALGLVGMTMVGVAAAAHWVADLPWATAFVLGAVVSPTDAIAATAIGRRLGVPRRLIDIVEGESLVNDGTALVLLKTAIAAAVAGTFSVWDAGWHLVTNIVGGIAIGLAVGYLIRRVRRELDNPPLEVTIAFLTGYLAFLPASAAGVSGVLAAVTAGVYMGWYTPELTTVQTRLQGQAFWEILGFLLNVLLFGLVGLQLRPILDDLSGGHGVGSAVGHAAVIVLVVIVLRIVWVFPATYVPRWLFPRIRERDPTPPWTHIAFISWNGMRGAVTIAAALLVPLHTDSGDPLAGRDLVVFFAFCVVLGTLVLQGLSMPAVIRALRLEADDEADNEEALARIRAAEAALERLEELEQEAWVLPDTAERMRGLYRFRIDRFNARTSPDGDGKIEKRSLKYQRLRRDLLEAERRAVIELRNTGEISDEVMRRVERDLDLEVSRLN